jgi:hypothetical protein
MAINATAANILPTTLEKVNQRMSYFLAKKRSAFANMFDGKNEKHNISTWAAGTVGSGGVQAFRVPVELAPGGDYQYVNLNGGDMGTGSMQQTAFMTIGAFTTDIAYNMPTLAMLATDSNEKAIKNALKEAVGGAITEQALYNEIELFQTGDGALTLSTSVVSGNGNSGTNVVYQLDDDISVTRLRRGTYQLVDIADASGVLVSLGARVVSISDSLNQVTITSGGNYTPTAGDQLVFPGMGPITTTTIATGTWRYGIYTYNTTATSGSVLGLPYSTAYELACSTVSAGGAMFNPTVVYSGASQLRQRWDEDETNGMVGVCHMAQRVAWYLDGLNIATQFVRNGESVKSVDQAGQGNKYGDVFDAGDIRHHVSRYATKNRVDWLVPGNFGKVRYQEPAFFTSPEGQRMFQGRNPVTGNIQAGTQFYAFNTDNLYSVKPGCAVVITGLGIPAGQTTGTLTP